MQLVFRTLAFGLGLGVMPVYGTDLTQCETPGITVSAPDTAVAQRACEAASHATEVLHSCGIGYQAPVRINVVEQLADNCFGLYHCNTGVIAVLTPEAAVALRHDDSPFADLSASEFFDSLIMHELAHVAFDDVPCPFGSCQTTAEYVSYSLQIMSLAPEDRAALEARYPANKTVSWDEINRMILLMAPKVFAQKAWAHLSRHDDRCAFLGQIMRGDIRFDVEMP